MSSTIQSRLEDPGDQAEAPGRGAQRDRRSSAAPRRRCAPYGTPGPAELAEEVKAQLPDEVVDGLLAGARSEGGSSAPAVCSRS